MLGLEAFRILGCRNVRVFRVFGMCRGFGSRIEGRLRVWAQFRPPVFSASGVVGCTLGSGRRIWVALEVDLGS